MRQARVRGTHLYIVQSGTDLLLIKVVKENIIASSWRKIQEKKGQELAQLLRTKILSFKSGRID